MTAQDRSSTDLSADSTVQDRSDFVSVAAAARRLGVSTATVKRRIRDGSLEAEPLSRPQGIEYRGRLPRDVTPALTAPDSDVPGALSEVSVPLAERSDLEKPPLNGSAHVTTQDILAAITAAVAPLTERLAVQDATIARQAETIQQQSGVIAELREDRGRLTAEVEALRTSQVQQDANPGPAAPAPTTDTRVPLPAHLRVLAPWIVALLALVALVGLVVVPH